MLGDHYSFTSVIFLGKISFVLKWPENRVVFVNFKNFVIDFCWQYTLVLLRVWLNRLWFGIHSKILNFHDWTICYNELFHDNTRKWKSMDLSMDLSHSNNMKVILRKFAKDHCFWTLWTLNCVDCIPFSCIISKFYSQILIEPPTLW